MEILSTIDNPSRLMRLSRSDLPALAAEMRERIIEVVSKNGGHLGPGLGGECHYHTQGWFYTLSLMASKKVLLRLPRQEDWV